MMNNFSYKGVNKDNNYFEGWYINLVDDKQQLSYVVIFGISLYEKDPHSFIQIINGQNNKSDYLRFSVNDFVYNYNSISIKDNYLSLHVLKLNTKKLTIDVTITDHEFLDTNCLIPGTMGFLKYFPLCAKHEILYLQANAKGTITDNNTKYDFDGISYMEKNWGSHFPKQWIWTQTNHFNTQNIQFVLIYTKLSIFDIPAFFCVLKIKGAEYRFATYNWSKIDILTMNDDHMIVNICNDDLKLNIKIDNNHNDIPIIAPVKDGHMLKVIGETINTTLTLSLYKGNNCLFNGRASHVHYENLYINQ